MNQTSAILPSQLPDFAGWALPAIVKVLLSRESGDYSTFVFQDYRLEIKATMAGGAQSAKSQTLS